MNSKNYTAHAEIEIKAPSDKVWDALVNPDLIKKYMFGTTMTSDWKVGSPIIWKGEWEGKKYEDKGRILSIEPGKKLQYNHFSPLSGLPDTPENYHTVTIELTGNNQQTHVSLTQDNNPSPQMQEHSEKNWNMMLESLKKLLE